MKNFPIKIQEDIVVDGENMKGKTELDSFIQTDFRVGLTEDNVNKAIKILNKYDEH